MNILITGAAGFVGKNLSCYRKGNVGLLAFWTGMAVPQSF